MSQSNGKIVDWESLAENFDNDKFAMSLIVDAFLESVDESIETVRASVKTGGKPMAMAAHSLKGAILNFGAAEAVRLAQALENIGYGEDAGDAATLFAALEKSLGEVVAELKSESHRYRE